MRQGIFLGSKLLPQPLFASFARTNNQQKVSGDISEHVGIPTADCSAERL